MSSATTSHTFSPYQTQYTDPTTGDVLMQARWYSASTGTFRSRDSYAGNLNTPVSLNRYTYASNNPIRYWDPNGRNPCQTADICSGKVVNDQGVRVATGTKATSFASDITLGGTNEGGGNPSKQTADQARIQAVHDILNNAGVVAPSSTELAAALILPSLGDDTQEMSARFEMVLDATARGSDNFLVGGELAGTSRVAIEEAMTFLMTDGQELAQGPAVAHARDLAANFCVGNEQYCADEKVWDEVIRAGGDLLGVFALGTELKLQSATAGPNLKPNVIVGPGGVRLPGIPAGAQGVPARTGRGMIYDLPAGTPGIDSRVVQIRVMDPLTTGPYPTPNGRVSYMNQTGQTVNPLTGQPVAKSDPFAHIGLPR